jgi:hypothetical protein
MSGNGDDNIGKIATTFAITLEWGIFLLLSSSAQLTAQDIGGFNFSYQLKKYC